MTDQKKTTETTTTKTEAPTVEGTKSPEAFRQDFHELTKPPSEPATRETRETHEKTTTTKTGE